MITKKTLLKYQLLCCALIIFYYQCHGAFPFYLEPPPLLPPPLDISVVSPPLNHLGTDAEATVIHHHCTYTAHTYSAYTYS